MRQIKKKRKLLSEPKKILAGCLSIVLMLGMIILSSDDVCAMTQEEIDYDDQYNISNYWKEKKVPVKDGFVFAGWYRVISDEKYQAITESELQGVDLNEVQAVAKFVPAYILSVKTQVSEYEKNGKTVSALRVLSSVDSTKYQEVGFDVQLGKKAHNYVICPSVYSAVKKGPSSDETIYPEETFGALSDYFMAVDINDISTVNDASIVYARPYWITLDGTKVQGLARNNRVEDHDADKDYISKSINLLNVNTEVAVGKIQVTYNAKDYQMVQNSNGEKIDAGRIFPKLMYTVDENSGTITFVGRGTTLNEIIKADGIFANMRFVKKADAPENANLQWNIDTSMTQFCDWNEILIEGISPQ